MPTHPPKKKATKATLKKAMSAEAPASSAPSPLNAMHSREQPFGLAGTALSALQSRGMTGMLGAAPPPASTGRVATKKKVWNSEELFDFKDSQGVKTGRYPKEHLRGVMQAALAVGQDPYEAAAFVLQESSLGMDGNRNLGYTYQEPTDKQLEDIRNLSLKTGIESRYLEPLVLYRDKQAYAKQLGYQDREHQIQAYNGLGVLTKQMVNGADKAYGIPIGDGIDMRKNPIYGKRVLALAQDMKRNPEVQALIATLQGL